MRKRTVLFLCLLIALMLVIIAVMTAWLYSSPESIKPAELEAIENVERTIDSVAATIPEPSEEELSDEADNPASNVGFPVVNCASGRENLLRQNDDLSLELIDHNGKSLWKIPFPGKLCGALVQVDFFSNRKIQFLVAEGSRVHLIDRLGREVSGFPRTMPSQIVYGPEEIMNHGVKYYKLQTKGGEVYFTLKDTKVITQLPE